jgi:hypothetical protein
LSAVGISRLRRHHHGSVLAGGETSSVGTTLRGRVELDLRVCGAARRCHRIRLLHARVFELPHTFAAIRGSHHLTRIGIVCNGNTSYEHNA